MVVAYVRTASGNVISDTLTLNIEVSAGSDRVLVVGVAFKEAVPQTPISIVFNGSESFSVERIAADGVDAQCCLYYLTAPSEVTADVVITIGSSELMCGFVSYYTGVDQTNPFTDATDEAQGNDGNPTVTISSDADEVCVDIMAQVSAGPDTGSGSHTEIMNIAQTTGGTDLRGCGQYAIGQASRTMDWSMSSTDHWNIIAAALQIPSVGWAGEVDGITNPPEVEGLAVANIAEIDGI